MKMSKKSAFRRPKRQYEVSFAGVEDETLHDFVVTFKSLKTQELLDLMEEAGQAQRDGEEGDIRAAKAAFLNMVTRLLKGIVEWNLTEDDDELTPIPVTQETLLDLEPDILFVLVDQWMNAVGGISAPLEKSSTNGLSALAEFSTTEQ